MHVHAGCAEGAGAAAHTLHSHAAQHHKQHRKHRRKPAEVQKTRERIQENGRRIQQTQGGARADGVADQEDGWACGRCGEEYCV